MKLPFGPAHLRWYVLRIKPQGERTAYVDLLQAGFLAYWPRITVLGYNRRQQVKTERTKSLLPGYIFAAQPGQGKIEHDWPLMNACKCVNGPLQGSEGPMWVPSGVVQHIWIAEFNGVFDETDGTKEGRQKSLESRFPIGSRARVMDGPFAGFLGIVESLTSREHLNILVDIFGRHVKVELEPGQVDEAA